MHVKWEDVHNGDRVWIDNYEGGKYPNACPKYSGPFVVHDAKRRLLVKPGKRMLQPFMHYPENLLIGDRDREFCASHREFESHV
jgi:hypothetical protein